MWSAWRNAATNSSVNKTYMYGRLLLPQFYGHHLVVIQRVKVVVPVRLLGTQCRVPLNDFPRSQLAEFRRAQVSQQVRGG